MNDISAITTEGSAKPLGSLGRDQQAAGKALPHSLLTKNQPPVFGVAQHEPPELHSIDRTAQANPDDRLTDERIEAPLASLSPEVDEGQQQARALQTVAALQDYAQSVERHLNFQLDQDSGVTVIKVFDADSDRLIRQIPSDEVLSLAQKLKLEEPLALFSARV